MRVLDAPQEEEPGSTRLAILLAMAMFVLVVDTSLMNVSISAVVEDLDTTASGVQSAIALEALVSAAFILINSKVGDLIGRKRAYVLGLLGYAIGAIAMTLAQSLTAIIIFWAIIGGLGASLLLPAMQSLIHGNFEGAAQKRAYALVGAAAAIAAAVGPLLGGFVTTYLSWRVGFLLEAVIIAIVLSGIRAVRDAPYTGPRQVDVVGALLSVVGMGGVVLGILVWQEGGESVGALMAIGAIALAGLAYWLVRRHREQKPTLLDPELFQRSELPARDLPADAAADHPGRRDDRVAALPADDPRVRRDEGGPVDRAALAQHVRASRCSPDGGPGSGARAASWAWASRSARSGWCRSSRSCPAPTRAGRSLIPLDDRGVRAGPAGVAAEQLHARAHLRGADQRGGGGELRGRLVRSVVRPGDGRRHHAGDALARLHRHGRVERRASRRRNRRRSRTRSRTTRRS